MTSTQLPKVFGFNQYNADAMGVTLQDLLIIRWLVDAVENGDLKVMLNLDGTTYYWADYSLFKESYPLSGITKPVFYRMISALGELGMIGKTVFNGRKWYAPTVNGYLLDEKRWNEE